MTIKFKQGLELWVWDSGVLEGFALYLNNHLLEVQSTLGMRYEIAQPEGASGIVVEFGGADGGATKVVDTTANTVLEHQDDGTRHAYLITE